VQRTALFSHQTAVSQPTLYNMQTTITSLVAESENGVNLQTKMALNYN